MPETIAEAPVEGDGEATPAPPPPKEYRNIVLTGFGGLKMLKVQKKAEIAAEEGHVLVKVKSW